MTEAQLEETESDQAQAKEENQSEDPVQSNDHELEQERDLEEDRSGEKISFIKRLLSNKKRLFLIIGIFLILLFIIIGLWLVFFSGSDSVEEDPETAVVEEIAPGSKGWKPPPVFEDVLDLASFEKILMKQGSAKGFVNMDISLHLIDSADSVEVFSKIDSIRRLVQDNIRQKTWLDIRGPQGKIQCKYELLSAINGLFSKRMLKDLYITNFIML